MDIRQLKYFLAIAEEDQITLAAKKLHMAQPSPSQQLKLLEDELGVKLVERGSRNMQLTARKSVFELAANRNLIYKEIESKKLRTQIAAIWVKDRYISPIALKFIESFGRV